jgi:WS/DGAT/MGAT family acyltransferase
LPRYDYERLSADSAAFLAAERPRTFAHSATMLLFDATPLRRDDGGIDFATIRASIAARLHRVPHFRRRLAWIPIENHPVWVDDDHFNLDYHVRHTSLPHPGNDAQLRGLAARIYSQRLDQFRPLWECWVLEGLEGDRFALLLKTHHALIAPGSGQDLLQALLTPEVFEADPPAASFSPRPVPSAIELVVDEVIRGLRLPRQALDRIRQLAADRETLRHEIEHRTRMLARMFGYTVRPRLDTPLNGPVGPHRRFHHMTLPLETAQRIRHELGGSVHDVILATVAGAARAFLKLRLHHPATLDFRIATPMRLEGGADRVGEWVVDLPLWEADPRRRLEMIRQRTRDLAEEDPARGADTIASIAAWTGSRWLALAARAASRVPVHTTLVNVPGPQVPLHLRGARLLEGYGFAPLRRDTALGITVQSYDGQLCWSLNADFDLLPDLERFSDALRDAFAELDRAAGGERHLALAR